MTPPENWEEFFDKLAEYGVIKAAAEAAQVSARTVYRHIDAAEKEDATPDQRAWLSRYKEARKMSVDTLKVEAYRRAVEGVDEPLIGRVGKDQDGVVFMAKRYSDSLLNLLLRAADPATFRDRVSTEVTGKDGGPIKTETKVIAVPAIEEGAEE